MFRFIAITLALCLMTITAQATLVGRAALTPGGTDYQAYYDTALSITWVADANLAKTSGYTAGLPGYNLGAMTWTAAVGWIASLNTQNAGLGYLGVTNWRLPTWTDTGTPGCNYAYTGTDCGVNVDLASGEMAHMYYSTLGNTGYFNTSGVAQPCFTAAPNYCLTNTGPFSNLQVAYWYGQEYAPAGDVAWTFGMGFGDQNYAGKIDDPRWAWAVSSGDTLNTVPIPPAVWLFGSALGLIGALRRKVIE